jgi:hypothetical protein
MLYRLLFFSVVFALAYLVFRPTGEILSETGFSQVVYSREKKPLRITLTNDDKYRLFCHVNSSGSLIKEAVLMKEDPLLLSSPRSQYFCHTKGYQPDLYSSKSKNWRFNDKYAGCKNAIWAQNPLYWWQNQANVLCLLFRDILYQR